MLFYHIYCRLPQNACPYLGTNKYLSSCKNTAQIYFPQICYSKKENLTFFYEL